MALLGSARSRGVLTLGVALLGAPALSFSAASAGKPLTKKRALKLFYKRSVADARFIDVGEKSSDAELLDGQDSTTFLGVSGKAADADKLDGLDSAAFQPGCQNGAVQAWARVAPPVESTYSDVALSWSCADVQIRARQISTGIYLVDFGGAELVPPCAPRVTVMTPEGDLGEQVFGGTDFFNDSVGGVPNCVARVEFFNENGSHTDFEDFTIMLLTPISQLVVP